MNLAEALDTFVDESRELLHDMEQALLAGGDVADRDEWINGIFRAAHTIKGSAGLFGLDHVVAFTHVAESVLDRVRKGQVELVPPLMALLLEARDHIQTQIEAIAAGEMEPDPAVEANGSALALRLGAYLDRSTAVAATASGPAAATADAVSAGLWHISLRFGQDTMRHGMDPLSFIHYLARLGSLAGVATLADTMPCAADMDPEACYLGFEIALRADTDREAIESVFEFVRDDCDLHIVPPAAPASAWTELMAALPEGEERIAPLLLAVGSLPTRIPDGDVAAASAPGPAAPAVARDSGSGARAESRSIRVDADRLDMLIDQIGELIIASAGTTLAAQQARDPELRERAGTMAAMVQAVRESALQLRMVRIGTAFGRFHRVVHDTARELGKEIVLRVRGEDTELDRTLVEKIVDPLTHLVRNAIDHGIEPPGERVARGKPPHGTVRLDAWHDSGSVVIEVSDDGAGLSRDRILAKGLERGLVEAGRELSDREVYGLIFEPGFSTAEAVTNLSGRGVGMDVVKRNITALRGSIAVNSQPGEGMTATIRLPLTLAIIDGFLVGVGDDAYVLPLESIEECVQFSSAMAHEYDADYLDLRGRVLPFIRLREALGIGGEPGRRRSIVVVRHEGRRVGLVVDALLGEFQTVIKPLGRLFEGLRCVRGSTVLGNGRVALILDVPALMEQAGAALSNRVTAASPALATASVN